MASITDWLMVGITTVYVIATVLICIFNAKSAKAMKEQTEELRTQFYMVNRPIITVEIVLMKGAFWAIRLTNRGTQTAFNVKLELDEDFILSIRDYAFTEKLIEEKRKEQTISVGQKYDLIFGGNRYTETYEKEPLTGRIIYKGYNGSVFAENFVIDMDKDISYFSVDSDIDGIINAINRQASDLQRISENVILLTNTINNLKEECSIPSRKNE